MSTKVKLTVIDGKLQGSEFVFYDRTICTVGRAKDCFLRLPNDLYHLDVSRHHCVLDINPPRVQVRDSGSRNGTYLNGLRIGRHDPELPPELIAPAPDFQVRNGDEIRVGGTLFRVVICQGSKGPVEDDRTVELRVAS